MIAECQDIERGKKNNHPNLNKAIEECEKQNVVLLIAKLDRLNQNASFIFMFRDMKVNFVCCDMPNANSVVLAQDERGRISHRTKSTLSKLKKKGVKLGTPENLTEDARKK